jgi:chromatin remodeling complex protein RSC6
MPAATKAKKPAAAKKPARKPNAAFMAPMNPTAPLAKIVGEEALPRTEAVKKVWAYIKKHKLQDPNSKRDILADDSLKDLFGGKKKVTMFELTKLVNDCLKK